MSFSTTPAVLVLEDGRTFHGSAYGSVGQTTGEAVFVTAMSGYQETLTDPSYHRQVVIQAAPHIGTTGINRTADESARIWAAGYVVHDASRLSTRWLAEDALVDWLAASGIVGLRHVETRALTRHLRQAGHLRVGIFSGPAAEAPEAELLARVQASPQMTGAKLVYEVSITEPRLLPATGQKRFSVAAVDLGIKSMTPQ